MAKNIEEKIKKVLPGNGGGDYYLDDGLMKKLLSKWNNPARNKLMYGLI